MKYLNSQSLAKVEKAVAIYLVIIVSLLLNEPINTLFAQAVDATAHQPLVEDTLSAAPDYIGAAYVSTGQKSHTAFTIIRYALAAIFGLAVLGKLSGKLKDNYQKWGYGVLFMYALAAVELIGVIGLFTPYSHYAAFLLLAIMLGAFFTLAHHREPFKQYGMAIVATILLIVFLAM